MGTTIPSGGPQYTPMEKTSSTTPITTPQEKPQEAQNTCETPQVTKKSEIPYPLLSGIEQQLEESFKAFKGDLKEAKDKTNILFSQDSGTLTGVTANVNMGPNNSINIPQATVNIESNFIPRLPDISISNSKGNN